MAANEKQKTTSELTSAGVQELVDRLRDEGVAAGRKEAEKIVADTKAEAKALLQQTNEEARGLKAQAHEEIEKLKKDGLDALELAARDTILEMKAAITGRFVEDVKRLISRQLEDRQLIKDLILEVAGQVEIDREGGKKTQILVSDSVLQGDRTALDASESLTGLTLNIAGDMLRQGVEIAASDDKQNGIRIRYVDDDLEVDLSDEAIATILLEHLLPRFRAMLEGRIR